MYDPADLRPGDLLLMEPGGPFLARLLDLGISLSTASPFVHVAIVGHARIISPLWRVTALPLDAYRANGWRYRVDATPKQRAAAAAWAEAHVGQRYGLVALLEDGLLYDAHIPLTTRLNPRRATCSGFCAAAYLSAGVRLTWQPLPSPASLSFSPLLLGERPWRRPAVPAKTTDKPPSGGVRA